MSGADCRKKLAAVRLAVFDVDGVFTDGRFYLSDDGVESKAFCTLDGYGIRQLLAAGIEVAVITGRHSKAVEARMAELGVRHVFTGCPDKEVEFQKLIDELGLRAEDCSYAGDDIPDLPLLRRVGVSMAVANAHREVRADCDLTTTLGGGYGAVREICDLILDARR